ncbi:MAG: hydrolase [Desulfobacula sp. GWF2_41_7]|nr:MAG: hydrolase [Desulfobacula sp. GWF2_41_7]
MPLIHKRKLTVAKFLKIGSEQIEIQWHRQEENGYPTLIFLHEGLGCTEMWKDFPSLLSQKTGCPSLVFSRLGYGASDPSPIPWKINFMHKEGLYFLPALMKEAKIRDHILIGHSDGGSISIIYAGSPYAKGLKALITMAAHVFCEEITLKSIYQANINYEYCDLRKKLEKYHGKNTENAFRGWNDVWLNPQFIHWNIEKYLPKIKIPMLAIQGNQDQYGSLKQLESVKQRAGNATIHIIEDCRHSPHIEQSEKVLAIITKFINETIHLSPCKIQKK